MLTFCGTCGDNIACFLSLFCFRVLYSTQTEEQKQRAGNEASNNIVMNAVYSNYWSWVGPGNKAIYAMWPT